MAVIDVFVPGIPAPQGSKRHVGHGRMIESCRRVPEWRTDIRAMLTGNDGKPLDRFEGRPTAVRIEFVLPRAKSLAKRVIFPTQRKNDLDKLARAVLDAVTSAGVWDDDSQVIQGVFEKRYCQPNETPGARIQIKEVGQCDIM